MTDTRPSLHLSLRTFHRDDFVFVGGDVALTAGTTVILGLNGSGKSTLLNEIAAACRALAMKCTYVPQDASLPQDFRCLELLTHVGALRRVSSRKRAGMAWAALEAVDLAEKSRAKVGALSGGMHQRLLLAQAMMVPDPERLVTLMDEPTSELDARQSERFWRGLKSSSAGWKVVATHESESALEAADVFYWLDRGQLVGPGLPSNILLDRANRGDSLVNTLERWSHARDES